MASNLGQKLSRETEYLMERTTSPLYQKSKRLVDVVVSLWVLILTSPILLMSMLLIKLTSPGPVCYRAKRAGLNGELFYMLKLRTMHIGLDDVDNRVTAENDSRITPIGKILRTIKLDELPQFWNVLKGEMTIVGPRPEDWDIVQRYFTPEQMQTLAVKPGIASSADVIWYPDMTYHDPPPEDVSMQAWYLERHMPVQLNDSLDYIKNRSFLFDLKILAQTAYCILVYSWRPPEKRPLPKAEQRENIT